MWCVNGVAAAGASVRRCSATPIKAGSAAWACCFQGCAGRCVGQKGGTSVVCAPPWGEPGQTA